MPAVIQSTLYVTPGGAVVPGSTQTNSRDDLRAGYQVVLHSVHVATTYSWSLSFASDSPGSTGMGTPFDGTDSSSALLAPEGSTSRDAKFNVDFEGSYLVRLVVDAGLPTEDTQFIRCRQLTLFGELKLVAAGERRDQLGVIPVDATPEGWANDQNANLQRVSLLLRRLSTSSRVLYVDANRGRDSSAAQDDYDNVIAIPGPDTARPEETGIKLRAMAHGDFSSINDAIAYAADCVARGEPALSKTDPYYIKIRSGLYTEDLNLTSFVHLLGDGDAYDGDLGAGLPGPKVQSVIVRTVNAGGTGTHTYNPGALATDAEVFLVDVHLENTAATSNAVLYQQGGLLSLTRCVVRQKGNDAAQGPAIKVATANPLHAPALYLTDSQVVTEALTATRSALYFDAVDGQLLLSGTHVVADACVGITYNPTLYENSQCLIMANSLLVGTDPFKGYPSYMRFAQSGIASGSAVGLLLSPPGGVGVKAGAVVVDLIDLTMTGQIQFNSANAVGTTRLTRSNVIHMGLSGDALLLPDAPGDVPTLTAYTVAESLRYVRGFSDPRLGVAGAATIPAGNQVAVEDVQRILDILWQGVFPVTGSPFYSLESAYNGLASISPFTLGTGLGRNIDAVAGAVQIQGATYPTGLELDLKHGGLQVEGVVDIGDFINGAPGSLLAQVGGSEIHLNPNMTGGGPFIGLGRAAWANGIVVSDRGFGGASVVAGGALAPSGDEAYHLHLRTADLRTPNTAKTGNVYVVAGSTYGANAAGEVHIVGGSHHVPGGTVGNLWLVPGSTATPDTGKVWFVGAPAPGAGARRATLLPAGPFTPGTAGTIVFGTPAGTEIITFTGAEANAAAAAVVVNAQARNISAADVGGTLELYSEYSPAGDIIYMGDSVAGALNSALGDYILGSGATFAPGLYGNKVAVSVPQDGRLKVHGDLEYTGALIPAPGGGGGFGTYVRVTNGMSPYVSAAGEGIFGVDTSGGNVNLVLPPGAAAGTAAIVTSEIGTGLIVVFPPGGETINGGGSWAFMSGTKGSSLILYHDSGTNWVVAAEYNPEPAVVRTITINANWAGYDRRSVYSAQLTPGVDITVTLAIDILPGRLVTIKDELGLANAIPGGQKIVVVDALGGLIDGAAAYNITVGYGSVTMFKTSTGGWAII